MLSPMAMIDLVTAHGEVVVMVENSLISSMELEPPESEKCEIFPNLWWKKGFETWKRERLIWNKFITVAVSQIINMRSWVGQSLIYYLVLVIMMKLNSFYVNHFSRNGASKWGIYYVCFIVFVTWYDLGLYFIMLYSWSEENRGLGLTVYISAAFKGFDAGGNEDYRIF